MEAYYADADAYGRCDAGSSRDVINTPKNLVQGELCVALRGACWANAVMSTGVLVVTNQDRTH